MIINTEFKKSPLYKNVEQEAQCHFLITEGHRKEYAKSYSVLALALGNFALEYDVKLSQFEDYFQDINPLMQFEYKDKSAILNIGRMLAAFTANETYKHDFGIGQLQRIADVSNEVQQWAFEEEESNPGRLSSLTCTKLENALMVQALKRGLPHRRKEHLKKGQLHFSQLSKSLMQFRDSIYDSYAHLPIEVTSSSSYSEEEWVTLSLALMSTTQVIYDLFDYYNKLTEPLQTKAIKELK